MHKIRRSIRKQINKIVAQGAKEFLTQFILPSTLLRFCRFINNDSVLIFKLNDPLN